MVRCLAEGLLLATEPLRGLFENREDSIGDRVHANNDVCLVSIIFSLLCRLCEVLKLVVASVGDELPGLLNEQIYHRIEEGLRVEVKHRAQVILICHEVDNVQDLDFVLHVVKIAGRELFTS